jgi:HTH-type transcriptional regulator/antitoxin HigA
MSTITTDSSKSFRPDYVVPPGETISDLLDEHEMTQTALASRLGVSTKHVNQVIKGAASISAELALGLEKVFGVSAAFWLSRESLHQARVAREDERRMLVTSVEWAQRFPIPELTRRGHLPRTAKGPDLVTALLEFFGIASPKQWRAPAVSFRKSAKFESDLYALSAWLRVGELRAGEIGTEAYDADRFLGALERVRSLTRLEPSEWQEQLVETCARAGVAVAIVDAFSDARANGATHWVSPSKALIQLSLRGKWEDIFWFTFFHEAAHVLLHRKKELFVEAASGTGSDLQEEGVKFESEADRFASRTLIPPHYERQLPQLSLNDVPRFAEEIGVAPAIVIGRMQHEKFIPFNRGNHFRRRFKLVEEGA